MFNFCDGVTQTKTSIKMFSVIERIHVSIQSNDIVHSRLFESGAFSWLTPYSIYAALRLKYL